MDCITAKRNLRRAQRQEEARKRNQLYSDIMESHMSNDKLFYKLVNSHRDCRAQKLTQLQVDGEMLHNSDAIVEGWVRYFQNLSKRLESDNFNAKYQDLVQLNYNEFEDFCRNNYKTDTEFVSLELLDKLVCEMINGKSQEEQLFSAEHLRFGGPSLVYLLKSIFEKKYLEKELYQNVLNLE
jgi:hypothetical protein